MAEQVDVKLDHGVVEWVKLKTGLVEAGWAPGDVEGLLVGDREKVKKGMVEVDSNG